MRVVAAETGWPTVSASEPELSRVVANLLVNAVRYTPPNGTVRIDAGLDRGDAWLAVSDGCGGIPEPDLPKVFDVAFRASGPVPPSMPHRPPVAAGSVWRSCGAWSRRTAARCGRTTSPAGVAS